MMESSPWTLDWQAWVERWDRMQEKHLFARAERFDLMGRLIADTQPTVHRILDLGCGPGTLTLAFLIRFPTAHVYGVDLDPTLLPLARARTARYADRAHFLQVDLRTATWLRDVPAPVDAVVSATALHWLNRQYIETLYAQMATVIRPGGIFLNADHAGSDSPAIQACWERHRAAVRQEQPREDAEDWEGFWRAYLTALGPDARQTREAALGGRDGIEAGLPLAWHLDQLRLHGFSHVDCFWRADCDAIYGGLFQDSAETARPPIDGWSLLRHLE